MKKKLLVIFTLVLVCVMAITLVACKNKDNGGSDTPAHEHTYSDEWTSDDTYHWHAATCEHTDEISGRAEHTWNDGTISKDATTTENGEITYTCTVCGKTKTVDTPMLSSIQSIAVKTAPTKTTYEAYEDIDYTGLEIEATYSDSSKAVLPITAFTFDTSKMDNSVASGNFDITATLKGDTTKFVTFTVTQKAFSLADGKYALDCDNHYEADFTITDGVFVSEYLSYAGEYNFTSAEKTTYNNKSAIKIVYTHQTKSTFKYKLVVNEDGIYKYNTIDILSEVILTDSNDYVLTIDGISLYKIYAIDGKLSQEYLDSWELDEGCILVLTKDDASTKITSDYTFTADTAIYYMAKPAE